MIKATYVHDGRFVSIPTTYVNFIDPHTVNGFTIKKEHQKDDFEVTMWGSKDREWNLGSFPNYMLAEKFVGTIYLRMRLEQVTDTDQIREDILNGQD